MSKSAIRECKGVKNEIVVKMPPKTAAQYSREYRARKKAQKNAYIPKPTPKTPTERSREFRARKRALQSAVKEHSTSSSSDITQNSSSEDLEIGIEQQKQKRKSKTSAERTRECRARKKALQKAVLEGLLTSSSVTDQPNADQLNSLSTKMNINSGHTIGHIKALKKKAKTPTERSRECRARKRALEKAMIEHLIITPSSVILQADMHQQNPLSEDLADLHPQNTLSENLADVLSQKSLSETLADALSQNALTEKFADIQQENTSSENIIDTNHYDANIRNSKEKSKTPTERSREFRARQKALENAVKHLPNNILLDNDICVTFGP